MVGLRNRACEIIAWAVFALILCGPLQAGQGDSDKALTAAANNELVMSLSGKIDSPDECFELIKRRLLEGDYEDVKAALDMRDEAGDRIFTGYRFAMLRARWARKLFRVYIAKTKMGGWPSDRHGAELRRLAKEATAAYEEAFKLADSDFERACVYASWHELHAHTHRKFEADSLLLRSGSPLEMPEDSNKETIAKQVSKLRPAVSKALKPEGVSGMQLSDIQKRAFTEVFIEEYRLLARMGVPEDVFAEMLGDVEEFVQKGLHHIVLREPEKLRMMIRFHIWYALTGYRPDKIDKEYIDKTIKTVDTYIREECQETLPDHEDEASKCFLEMIGIERSNRFIPRMKRPIWPNQWTKAGSKTPTRIEKDVLDRIKSNIARIAEKQNSSYARMSKVSRNQSAEKINKELARIEKRMEEGAIISLKHMAAWVSYELNTYQQLGRPFHPPGVQFNGCSGTTHNRSHLWIYTSGTDPVPPYPWKKIITLRDSHTWSTRKFAMLVIKAFAKNDSATLNTQMTESRDFTKEEVKKLVEALSKEVNAGQTQIDQKIKDVFLEGRMGWSAVSFELPGKEPARRLALVFRYKKGGYRLGWAGIVEGDGKSLASVLKDVKPGLELPPTLKLVEIVPPSDIASVGGILEMQSVKPLNAGHGWQVRLGFGSNEKLSGMKFLYCRADWTDQNNVPRAIPFRRYAGRHLGPVIWTFSANGFADKGPDLNSRPAALMTVTGEKCTYAASLPVTGFTEGYVQVYSAFDGRELAREIIKADDSDWPWGLFLSHKKGEPFGVGSDFQAMMPGMPAFWPIDSLSAENDKKKDAAIKLSLDDRFFQLKAGKRILPVRGSRLLARWWVNGKAVMPQAGNGFSLPEKTGKEHSVASIFRLPAKLPASLFKAKKGDKISLQVMLCPDRFESLSRNNANLQNIACLDRSDIPRDVVLSNRIDFKVDKDMLAKPNMNAPTAAGIKKLIDAIEKRSVKKVKKQLAANRRLVNFVGSTGYKPLEFLCWHRPRIKRMLWMRLGDEVTKEYWEEMSEIAGILIDYGADVNYRPKNNRDTVLMKLLEREQHRSGDDNALPIELMKLLLDRGADTEASNHEGTPLMETVNEVRSNSSPEMAPLAEVLLEYDADVFATNEPWSRESVYDMVGSLKKKKDYAKLADAISKYGEKKRKVIEKAVTLGVEELLGRIRFADEEALASAKDEFPWEEGLDLIRMGRHFQETLGASLEGVGKIEKIVIKGNWAEALLPTGRKGEYANLHIILMRYPGGGYHALSARLKKEVRMGSSISHAKSHYGGLMNSVYSVFEQNDMSRISGSRSTGYPSRFKDISISRERGRLVVKGLDVPSWKYFYAELTSDVVYFWDDIWQLNLSKSATFKTGDKQLIMAKGVMTVENSDKTVQFDVSGDKVRMKAGDKEQLGIEFILDLDTLDIRQK